MKTKAEKAYDIILVNMDEKEKNKLILECLHLLDVPYPWGSETVEHLAQCFIRRRFVIRGPHDYHLFEPSELE